MEQVINIGDRQIFTFEFETKKEIEVADITFSKNNDDNTCCISSYQPDRCYLSTEELCTFIKLLVSHLELSLEFK